MDEAVPIAGIAGEAAVEAVSTDEYLMQAVQQGDEKAFELLMNRYKTPITNYMSHMLRERERARELAQETFLKVYRAAPRYRPSASFSTWLYTIATNLGIEELRRRKRWSKRLVEFGREEHRGRPSTPAGGSPATLKQQEISSRVRLALRSLPAKYRVPVLLRDIQGLSYQQVSDITRLPLGTVKTRLNRGRLLLKEKLTPYVEALV